MGALMRSIDWSRTAVGAVSTWPQSLRTALSILLETGFPMYIAWGSDFTQFYNDGYRPILGSTKHPAAMGASTRQTFAEIWDIIGPMFAGVMHGTPTTVVDFLLPLDRHGFVEECYFIFSYSPIRQEDGTVGGVLVTVTETTPRVLGERRLKTTQELAGRTRQATTIEDACAISGDVLGQNAADLPFGLIYLVDRDASSARLTCAVGATADSVRAPRVASLSEPTTSDAWPIADAVHTGRAVLVDPIPLALDAESDAPAATRALVLPIAPHGEGAPIGVLVAGLSTKLLLDSAYQDFLAMVAAQIGTAVVSARALEEAEARAQALADLDRAKTAFFSNVSHEFRTPLTLLLGPAEEAVSTPGGVLQGEDLETVYRNAQRLLKLVNTLLDFSRIEAGRVRAVFEPTDLSALTADLASAFRSATERAGLDLVVECPPLPEPVYVDHDMWEKVVLNLLSNAFKFTFTGTIRVSVAWRGSTVALSVQDTGVGIAPDALPHIFDRFHRIERGRARTHEGSGIGLALVRELVAMHGGHVDVSSVVNEGTTFTVTVPTGFAHLPADRIGPGRPSGDLPPRVTPYVQEALRWLPTHGPLPVPTVQVPSLVELPSARVLVADDNADMRDYITRLLADRWTVDAVTDGASALIAARTNRPDVIVADVMMPGLDGFQLIHALRADDQTRSIPVILVSARAGEEARVEGLDAGADDYLVKPFSARELLARVQGQVVRAKVRSVEEAHGRRLASIFEHAPVGVAILRGPEHVFDYVNQSYLSMIGGRFVIGKPIRDALPELDGQGFYELLDGVFSSGQPHVGHSVRILLDRGGAEPDEAFFDFVYQPLTRDGRVEGIAALCYEVTALARARRDAEAANRAKDEFLAMLGHELRNPLAPILTALQLMELRGVAGADRERRIIERQVRHVVGLVDDLLDVSRITRGKVQLRTRPLSIADVVAKAIEMASPAIEERRHALHVDVDPRLEVEGDPARLAQVFANLLNNAAKYTDPQGTIRVWTSRAGDSVEVHVADNGRGISPEMLPRVFELFAQERQDLERSGGGLGIGLAIVRSLVQAHGGSVHVSSGGKGRGSTFTVTLPAGVGAALSTPTATIGPAAPSSGYRILVVDDNEDAAVLLADSLRALGHTVAIAHDGPSALRVVSRFSPEVALLDLGLPVMDGFELGERLRHDPHLREMTMIAVTGYAQEPDRRRTAATGFDAHVAKPIDVHELDRLIRTRVKAPRPTTL
ncbi:MAG: response regulator [Acidobacteria bacterium]|nr:response regulator [Acidobacteriota bacterium]